ncbi:MAG: extracellular solute-binding protein [Chloroflexi bacterium]|nr:extracellular solute-binding protein [Chloroflexota bacterium]
MERHQQRLTRRQALAGMGAGIGLILLSACAEAQPTPQPSAPAPKPAESKPAEAKPAAPSKAPVTIKFSVWGDIQDKDVYDNVSGDFNKIQDRIVAVPEQWVGQYYEKLQTQLAGGVPPDIVYTQSWRWQPFAAKGTVVELDPLRQRDKWDLPWPNLELYDVQMKMRGKTYVQPSDVGSMVMFYSKDQFDKAGLKYPTDNWTYEQFVEAATKLTRAEVGTKYFGYQTNAGYARMAPWMRMNGEIEWDTVSEPKKARWDQPTIIEAWQFQVYDAINTIKCSPTPAELQGGANQIQSGNVAMKVEGPWFLPQMMGPKAKREGGTPFNVVMLPKSKTGKQLHMGFVDGHYILKASKNQDAAWEFLKYVGGDGGQKRVAEGGRQPNTPEMNRKYWVEPTRKDFGCENAEAFVKAMETGIIHLVGEITDAQLANEAGLQAAIDAMIAGQKKAAELIPAVNTQIQKVLDEYWAKQK